MNDAIAVTIAILGVIWLIGSIGFFVYGEFSIWRARRNALPPEKQPEYEVVHGGSGIVPGCLTCMMWPLILPIVFYEWIRYKL